MKQSSKWRIILYVLGALALLSVNFGFDSSVGVGFLTLSVAIVLIAIPTVSIIIEKTSSKQKSIASPVAPSPSRTYAPVPQAASMSAPVRKIEPYYYSDYDCLHDLPHSYVCVDVETTGLDAKNDHMTEIAAARVEGGVVTNTFSTFVHSSVPIPAMVSRITGITDEMIADAPEESSVLSQFLAFVGDYPIVGYNISFDLGFLHYAAQRACQSLPRKTFDVHSYAKRLLPGKPGYKLCNVAEYLAVDQPTAHRALADVLTTVSCAERLRPIAEEIAEKERKESARQKAIDEYDFSRVNVDYKSIVPTVDQIDPDAPFCGKRVVFTRELVRMTRQEACQIVANLGGQPWGSVTKGTAYLVVGDGPATPYEDQDARPRKVVQAEAWQAKGSAIQVISETAFFEMVDDYKGAK